MFDGMMFFYILIPILIVIGILGLNGVRINKNWVLLNLVLLIGLTWGERGAGRLILYALFEGIIIWLYSRNREIIKEKGLSKQVYYIMLLAGTAPLVFTKIGEVSPRFSLSILGISYITFRAVGTIMEINDLAVEKVDFFELIFYLTFFPTILAGPIDRFRRFKDDLIKSDEINYGETLKKGIRRFISGIVMKFIFAQGIYFFFINSSEINGVLTGIGYMYSYAFYLYFDFLGYSLLAMGVGNIMGVDVPVNFKRPFFSRDIKEFWNRWHMSLSFWFRDHIYSRFVLKSMKKKRFKSKYTTSYIGYIITMGLMGIWHGLYTNYIVYGIYHGLLICGTDYFYRKTKFDRKMKKNNLLRILGIFITFNLVCFGFLIFSGTLFGGKIRIFGG